MAIINNMILSGGGTVMPTGVKAYAQHKDYGAASMTSEILDTENKYSVSYVGQSCSQGGGQTTTSVAGSNSPDSGWQTIGSVYSGGHDMNYFQGTNDQYRYYRCSVTVKAGGNGVAAVFLNAKK